MNSSSTGRQEWDEVLIKITCAIKELNAYPDALMFRGHRDESWSLVPSLFRECNIGAKQNESNIYQVFCTRGFHLLPRGLSDWETLAFMQHCKLPTRLLDWSDSFGVAVYFALFDQPFREPEDSAIWILDALNLSHRATGYHQIFSVAVEKFDKYSDFFVEKDSGSPPSQWPYESPVAIEAPWAHERLVAQRGFFTVHGQCEEPLEKQCPDTVRKIVLPKTAILYARKYLRLAGIDHFRMFPDLDGLSLAILDEYCRYDLESWRTLLCQ